MALNSVVISDSRTLISLLNIEKFELLFKFSDTILITEAVYDEVTFRKSAKRILDEYISTHRVIIKTVDNKREVEELQIKLDLGESESIILAKQERLVLIIDEKKGRNFAKAFGIETIGLVGILLIYKRKGYLLDAEMEEIVSELLDVDLSPSFHHALSSPIILNNYLLYA